MKPPADSPTPVVPMANLVPLSDHLRALVDIPPSRMFLINKSLAVYQERHPGGDVFDASQGDGGASLPGVSGEILDRAAQLQHEHGSAYDMPYGTDEYRRCVVSQYWQLGPESGLGPKNVIATVGGRDALAKAYTAMLALGHGRTGDFILVSRVPWLSYAWGPYGLGANVLLAPGEASEGWAYSVEGLQESLRFAATTGRKIAGLIITSPDNPTGNTLSTRAQVELGKAALALGIPFVLYDWMYHYVTNEQPMNLQAFILAFDPEERERLMFLDGITKSLGASNVRNCHLIASEAVIRYIVARASHTVIPSFYSMAVAMAAYEMGYARATRPIVEPTNASREALRAFLNSHGFTFILGKGYYAFIHVKPWLERKGWNDGEPLGKYLAEEHGLAIVPGAFFSRFGGEWIRFSYAQPVEKTLGSARRLLEGLNALVA
ncbi:MAG: aminotransferase class I/II-fold pyridoxal phosphate-dependent enzyme [Anaerolineales bacterium]|jgi:aspartate/methionine/tyrosine aminotransferase